MWLSHLTHPRSSPSLLSPKHLSETWLFLPSQTDLFVSASWFLCFWSFSPASHLSLSSESSFLKHILDHVILNCLGGRGPHTYMWASGHPGSLWNWTQKSVSPWFFFKGLCLRKLIFKLFSRVQSAILNCTLVTLSMFWIQWTPHVPTNMHIKCPSPPQAFACLYAQPVMLFSAWAWAHEHPLSPGSGLRCYLCEALPCPTPCPALPPTPPVHNRARTTKEMLNRFWVSA